MDASGADYEEKRIKGEGTSIARVEPHLLHFTHEYFRPMFLLQHKETPIGPQI